ncbi:DMT family transporter [Sinanaerobacter sp. ZZT-01]|uniref:DMT family transporter n=1 Tax=Sinanaerobacter sp. ZZT-01 TaxID=3111540 RepID=UPI002D76B9BE|nr:DMT family transporter [Sinanaerobacter sp. ZZT-01]WRR92564.1 DMT family transporter [Sinanaerobacter sp. ZZT-01]
MNLFYSLWSFLTGISLIIQIGINGRLKDVTGNSVFSALTSFAVGTLTLLIALIIGIKCNRLTFPSWEILKQTSFWMWSGGIIGAFYVFAGVIIPGKIGFSNFFTLLLSAQLITSVIADHFGWFGNPVQPISFLRVLGIAFMIVGVFFIQKN